MTDISAQLAQQIDSARAEGRRLNIVGGGSKGFMGRAAVGEPLAVGEHRGIVDYQPVELVLTARAGTPLVEIEAALEERGQMLSFEPPQFGGGATLGGTLACNQSGPARPWGGSVRDQVLGIRLLNGRGEHLRFGGQVMKNVAGYDVSRLMAGALGTLGVITEVSLKVLPKPAHRLTRVEMMSLEQALRVMTDQARRPDPLSAACWHAGRLYLRFAGARTAVESAARRCGGQPLEDDDAFWRALRDQQLPFFGDQKQAPLWRFSFRANAEQPDLPGDWLVDWGGAQRWWRGQGELVELERVAAAGGGQVGLFRGGDRDGEVFHRPPALLQALQQRIKAAFDPDGVFNPGRLYSWM